jgi:hypothetical protein
LNEAKPAISLAAGLGPVMGFAALNPSYDLAGRKVFEA